MSVLNFNPKWGRYEVTMLLDCWYIEPTTFSGHEDMLIKLVEARREQDHRQIDAIYTEINIELKELGMINE